MSAIKTPWTNKTIELLKSRVNAGFSCREIAHELGVTRNSVIGKISRLRLWRQVRISNKRSEPKSGSKVRSSKLLRHFLSSHGSQQHSLEGAQVYSGERCTIFELSRDKCRWPIGNPDMSGLLFCGNAPIKGLPYCSGHARIAYRLGEGRSLLA